MPILMQTYYIFKSNTGVPVQEKTILNSLEHSFIMMILEMRIEKLD